MGENDRTKVADVTTRIKMGEKMIKIKVVDFPHTEWPAFPLIGRPLIRHDMESQFFI